MDINHKDSIIDLMGRTAYQLRLSFTKDGEQKTESPSEVFDKVREMLKKNAKEVRMSVGRLGDLLVGGPQNPSASFFFAIGWYMRKAVELFEKDYGKCTIQYESEEMTKESAAQYLGNYLKRESEKLAEISNEILKGSLPEDLFGDSEASEPE